MANKAVIIVGGLVVGGVLILALTRKAKAAPLPPSDIKISNLVINPESVNPGGKVSITCTATNTGGTRGSYTVILGGDFSMDKTITLSPGETQTVSFQVTAPSGLGIYHVSLDGLSGDFEVVEEPVANIKLSNLVISPQQAYPGDPITISAIATNIGNASGSRTVTLTVS